MSKVISPSQVVGSIEDTNWRLELSKQRVIWCKREREIEGHQPMKEG